MNWLTNLDTLYASSVEKKNNKQLIYYPLVNIKCATEGVEFIFRKKNRKTQILFKDEYGRRVYLTDVDIINILVEAKDKIFTLIHQSLVNYLIEKHQNKLIWEIENKTFESGFVMPEYSDQNKEDLELLKKHTFNTVADFEVSYYDLLVLISLIVDKEYVVNEVDAEIRKARQLKKFIVLTTFYRNYHYAQELEENGYNVGLKIEQVYYNKSIAKEIDKVFDKIKF
ncbi:hypothetical protein JYA63_02015 [Fictibacillus nanhaiensis]|uniref:DUF1828 domain-containing protein n=1 Tax=Fictibacillus nanhaiensis TaxID=742169 RepID=A0ABS2ZNX1_9BACL|nr:hypothetical protein [Fictibacillus nanhaiensis]